MPPLDIDKAALRARSLAARRDRPLPALASARRAITAHVLTQAARRGWRAVAAYEPLRGEPGSHELLAALHARHIRVLVPITLASRDLTWRAWSPGDRTGEPTRGRTGDRASEAGSGLGIDAIGDVAAVLAPALAVAADGTRLGRGGGSYDRALLRTVAGTVVVGVLFDDELVDVLPRDPWDVPVTATATPSGWRNLPG